MNVVDTRGLTCPAPLIKTRQGLTEAGALLADLHLSGHPEAAVVGTIGRKGVASLCVAN